MLVEKAPGNGAHRAHHNGARQNDQARNGRRITQVALQVDRHQNACRQKRALHEHANNGAHQEFLVRKHAHLEHGAIHLQLATEEQHHDNGADERDHRIGDVEPVRADGRKAIQKAAETDGRKRDRRLIERQVLRLVPRRAFQCEPGADNACRRKRHHNPEQHVPVVDIDHETGRRRANGGRECDDDAEQAHG